MSKKNIVIYPGTFDPITYGHLDIIDRAIKLFDEVVVGVAYNINKTPLFTKEERRDLIIAVTKKYKNVRVEMFNGLLVDFAKSQKASVILRGLRAISDFEYEFQMSLTNRKLAPQITTMFLMPNEKYTYLNSSLVRELSKLKGDISSFVPPIVEKNLKLKLNQKL